MIDKFGRQINYLRISVTDMCNLRCIYCMPAEGISLVPHNEILRFEEIYLVARIAAELGVTKIRLTGGEPLVRKGIESLVGMLASVPGIDDLSMTTNGLLLKRDAAVLKEHGLQRLNVSLDTLDPSRYHTLTRGGELSDVLEGIEAAISVFGAVKLNVVVMRGMDDREIARFAEMTVKRPIDVRFIEFMAIGKRGLARDDCFVANSDVRRAVEKCAELQPEPGTGQKGPAALYRIKGAAGRIGFISPVSAPFCSDCNRLRLTARGVLRSCLLVDGETDVKEILRNHAGDTNLLREAFFEAAWSKPISHTGMRQVAMSQIGG